jgi:ferredoxin
MNTVSVDPDVCEAFGRCVATVPAVFSLDDDEMLHIHQPTEDQLPKVRVAVRLCPKLALTLNDD